MKKKNGDFTKYKIIEQLVFGEDTEIVGDFATKWEGIIDMPENAEIISWEEPKDYYANALGGVVIRYRVPIESD